jgi:hypothetical protein
MKRIILATLMFATLLLLQSCVKDRSNLTEHTINELEIFLGQYYFEKGQGERFNIEPIIRSNIGVTDEGRYRFEWTAIVYTYSSVSQMFIPLATTRNLESVVRLAPNMRYHVRYRVFDTVTGVFAQTHFDLFVTDAFTFGWLIMNEIDETVNTEEGPVNVRMRLDMLPLRMGQLSYVEDVLAVANSELPMAARGRPIGMLRFSDNVFSPNNTAFYILTETGSNRLANTSFFETNAQGELAEVNTFAWRPNWNIRNHFLIPERVPEGFIADVIRSADATTLIASQGNLYYMESFTPAFFGDPVNRTVPGGPTFRASSKFAGTGGFRAGWIVYDENSQSFRQIRRGTRNAGVINETPTIARFTSYENMTDFELVTILGNDVRPMGIDIFIYIIKRQISTGRYWIMQSMHEDMRQEVWEEMGNRRGSGVGDGAVTQNLIHQAATQERPLFVAGGFHTGNIYFAVGGRVYVYNMSEGVSREVLHRPGREITYMQIQGPTTLAGPRRHAEDILVASFDGTNGHLEQFFVEQREPFIPVPIPGYPTNTNFGRIIDVLRR